MKIAVVGCGAVGSYYGAKLGHTGLETHFLLRSDYEVVRRDGVRILSPDGDFVFRPHCARDPREIGICDLVLIALKTTANDQFESLLTPLVGNNTAVLTLQNGLGNEAQLAELFGAEKVLGGLCFVCLNRIQPGVVQHVAHGMIVMGEYQRPSAPRTHLIAGLIEKSGVSCRVTENLEQTHWEKLVWNIPFNGLGVAGAAGYDAMAGNLPPAGRPGDCLTSDQLLTDPRWEQLVRELMLEVVATANALGLDVPLSAVEKQISRTRTMGAYSASTLVDFKHGQPLELESMFLRPLEAARRIGQKTPRLEALCRVLGALEKRLA